MKMMNKFCALMLSVALCAGMAAPAFAYGGEPVEEAEQPVLTSTTDEEDVVTVTDEETGALTPEGNLTLVDDYHTNYSDGSGQQFITLVSKSGATFYLVIDRNDKGENTVHFMNLVDEADLLSLIEEDAADAYTAEKEAAAQAEQERKQAEKGCGRSGGIRHGTDWWQQSYEVCCHILRRSGSGRSGCWRRHLHLYEAEAEKAGRKRSP